MTRGSRGEPCRRLLREPLVHFLAAALLIFGAHGVSGRGDTPAPDRIVVTGGKVGQLATTFARTWQRPPTPQELKGLIDEHVKDEILYREATALGMDEDDAVIRRRLRQKMELLIDAEADADLPTEADLAAYLQANPDGFALPSRTAFEQVFLNPERHGDELARAAASALRVLAGGGGDPGLQGDPTLLPPAIPLSDRAAVAATFRPDFARALDAAPEGSWSGPVASSYGLHLVHVTAREPGRLPALAEARAAVAREWSNDHREAFRARRLAELLKRYEVTVETPAASPAP